MDQILGKHNILPSVDELYNATSIWLVVKTEIGATPTVSCVLDKVLKFKKKETSEIVNISILCNFYMCIIQESGLTYLSEIRMCFRRGDLQLVDCNEGHHSSNGIGNCPPHKLIHYPGNVVNAPPHRQP